MMISGLMIIPVNATALKGMTVRSGSAVAAAIVRRALPVLRAFPVPEGSKDPRGRRVLQVQPVPRVPWARLDLLAPKALLV